MDLPRLEIPKALQEKRDEATIEKDNRLYMELVRGCEWATDLIMRLHVETYIGSLVVSPLDGESIRISKKNVSWHNARKQSLADIRTIANSWLREMDKKLSEQDSPFVLAGKEYEDIMIKVASHVDDDGIDNLLCMSVIEGGLNTGLNKDGNVSLPSGLVARRSSSLENIVISRQ